MQQGKAARKDVGRTNKVAKTVKVGPVTDAQKVMKDRDAGKVMLKSMAPD